jgi:hypothetical protein
MLPIPDTQKMLKTNSVFNLETNKAKWIGNKGKYKLHNGPLAHVLRSIGVDFVR